jgi:4'-phosphopantetheinyl transferase EntD
MSTDANSIDNDALTRQLSAALPESVALAIDHDSDAGPPPLLPEECEALGPTAPTRRRDFARGRACARRALSALGMAGPILRKGREPVWPQGAVGSITHCRELAAALAASKQDVINVGIDAETCGRVPKRLQPYVATAGEAARLEEHGEEALTVLWCAKEALFKCLFPETRTFLHFVDVEVGLDWRNRRFSIATIRKSTPSIAVQDLCGWFADDGRHVVAACVLPLSGIMGSGSAALDRLLSDMPMLHLALPHRTS